MYNIFHVMFYILWVILHYVDNWFYIYIYKILQTLSVILLQLAGMLIAV